MRLMGLDYGNIHVGVALSDELCVTAYPLEVIKRKDTNKLRKTFARIEEIAREYKVDKIIVGLPLNMDDSESELSKSVMDFSDNIKRRTGLPVELWDERLSTFEATDILKEAGVRYQDRKNYIDKIAASFILRRYMEENM
ncbi:Holliday junction resolvase RuvX [Howardella ureilytica]|nr:Holliday junction resolvase RuvX [Lachnospiraceae bacterium]MDY2956984.1 Holliday junction resolvase RuvX [Lachnospiraceae bacterium]